MKEYIEREALLKEFSEIEPANWMDSEAEIQAVADHSFYRSIVENTPAADVKQVIHGMWRVVNNFGEAVELQCSACKYNAIFGKVPMKFCPNCGADMRGVNIDE